MVGTFTPFHHLDRQWDARFNVPTDQDLENLLAACKAECAAGKMQYLLVGGVEIGDRPYQNDYLCRHVHVALVYNNRVSKSSILKNLVIKTGNGYYLVPRKRDLSFSGWREHHTKAETKINTTHLIYEYGTLPKDVGTQVVVKRSTEEKKRKLDDIIIEMKGMIEKNQDELAFAKFPRNYLTYGEKIKAMINQKRDFFHTNGHPHIWLKGGPGCGKSAILQVVYPDYYNKDLQNRFFDLYDPKQHTHVLLQDVDHAVVEKLGVQFLKTICDEAGFPIDQKYKTPQLARTVALVSSNFGIEDVLPEDLKGRSENLLALRRRFWEVDIKYFLQVLGVKLLDKYEVTQLKKAGNKDPRKLFLSWDYGRDIPTGDPLPSPEELQTIIKDKYYGPTKTPTSQ
ncbi:hypothetical protein PHYBOEH_008711 [Phytophthora boehmeriae]|uniref:Replication protein n=1 Tax=Phytophthora boehmeriae TaxID=109152 RepID=A0A8T1VYM1_9STRA|nr:hypothetical protein PHYBOEH_008711 [Phytophthora boehmeriae]